MIIRDRSFPHPVLAPFRDDVLPNTFELALQVSDDADNFYLDVSLKYTNETLLALTDAGNATHCVHVECRRNFYRQIFRLGRHSERVAIRASELVGRVEVSAFIKARTPIPNYSIAGLHSDYGSATFEINPGDVLAVANSMVFDAYVDYDPLRTIASILTVQRSDEHEEGPMSLDMTGPRIVATLSQKDYDRYADLKADPSLGPLLANQVVVPALLEAVHEIRSTSDEEFDVELDKRWFRSVHKKLKDLGIDIRSNDSAPIHAMQALLKLPLRRSLEGLIQMDPPDEKA